MMKSQAIVEAAEAPVNPVTEEVQQGESVQMCGLNKYWFGVGVVLLIVLLSVGSSFLTKTILKGFRQPFFLAYLSVAALQVFYIFRVIKDPIETLSELEQASFKAAEDSGGPTDRRQVMSPAVPMKSPVFHGEEPPNSLDPASRKDIQVYGAVLFLSYFCAVYLSNVSFRFTTVASSTIMGTTNCFFLLLLGWAFGTDKVTLLKLLAITTTFLGACTLVASELWHGRWRLAGNLMSFASAFLFSLYSVVLTKLSGNSNRVSQPLLFATVGTYSMLFLWPIFIVLHYADIERFLWPYDLESWASILFNILFGTLVPTYLWTLAFKLTSPLVVAVGVSCAVPLTLIFELAYSNNLPWNSVLAGSLVLAGFLLINTKSLCHDKDQESDCCTVTS